MSLIMISCEQVLPSWSKQNMWLFYDILRWRLRHLRALYFTQTTEHINFIVFAKTHMNDVILWNPKLPIRCSNNLVMCRIDSWTVFDVHCKRIYRDQIHVISDQQNGISMLETSCSSINTRYRRNTKSDIVDWHVFRTWCWFTRRTEDSYHNKSRLVNTSLDSVIGNIIGLEEAPVYDQ